MTLPLELPADYQRLLQNLEDAYLQSNDPIRQSGFGGGAQRWYAERSPILDAITAAGDLIDIGCANGYLLECLLHWADERGQRLIPHGVDLGAKLIELAKARFPSFSANFYVGNAWSWQPPRQYAYVYTLYDCVPLDYVGHYAQRLLSRVVAPGGRLIMGAYGSRLRQLPPLDVAEILNAAGLVVAGIAQGGEPLMARFAWVDKPENGSSCVSKTFGSVGPLSYWARWRLAARPKTLPAAIGPVLVGTALAVADGRFVAGPALAALLGALLLQIGSNFANDYFDFFRGADTQDRLGPPRVTASGLLQPAEMRLGMVFVFGLAALLGLYLIYVGGWPVLAIGAASILAALAYTGGPFPFGYYGLGDLFVLLFFGVVAVCGAYYVQALALPGSVFLASLAPGLLITAILVVNNLRDIDTDRRANKRTLAVLIGRQATQWEYRLLLYGAYVVVLLLWLVAERPLWVMATWLTLPLAVALVRSVANAHDGPTFNAALAATARLSLLFSAVLAIGLIL